MQKKIVSAIVASALSVSMANASETKNEKLLNDIKKLEISKRHSFVPLEIKNGGSMIFAKGYFDRPKGKQNVSMYLSQDLKTAVYGRGYNTANAKEYTSYSISELKNNAAFTYGTGTDEYFLVIDPLCPACKTFDKTLPSYEKNIKIHVIFLPLTRIHPAAPKAISYILSGKTDKEKFERLQKISDGDETFSKIEITPENQIKIDKQILLAVELGTRGTPSLYMADGKKVNRGILQYKYKTKKD